MSWEQEWIEDLKYLEENYQKKWKIMKNILIKKLLIKL